MLGAFRWRRDEADTNERNGKAAEKVVKETAEQTRQTAESAATAAENASTAARQTTQAATRSSMAAETSVEAAQTTASAAVITKDSAERRTELAGDRTIFAAERTYAAWVRTGLVGLAGGIGAPRLLEGLVPGWMAMGQATVLLLFAIFCFVAGVAPGPWAAPAYLGEKLTSLCSFTRMALGAKERGRYTSEKFIENYLYAVERLIG